MPLTPGTRLGPYAVVAPLGAGGMGDVYRARDSRLGRDVAIKVLPPEFAEDPERLARVEREAQALGALNHPNVASIYGLEDASGITCLVLELVAGETLGARLGRGSLSLREALALGVQMAAALEAAHERGIVQRDLKPGNVMVSEAGIVKVLDFGLAKYEPVPAAGGVSSEDETRTLAAAPTEAGIILGTAAYMSPEQARGRAVDRRSDVWSFGCVLFECLAGRAPFAGETITDLLARILEREPDWSALPAGTPSRVRDILRRCLRKDAAERPRDIRDVRLELAEVAAGATRGVDAAEKSIAVLPFENLSGSDDEYFADGITEEILNALGQIRDLRVAARTSCFAFKGRREDLRAVSEKLDVATVVEGSVRRAGPHLRITAQLVNATDGYQLWSERYGREMTDVFAVQDEIATAIATRLRVALHGAEEGAPGRAGTRNLDAYELLLRGRALHARRGRLLRPAIECLEKALALDPHYAEALGLLADSYRLLATFGGARPAEASVQAKRLAERSIAIDPDQAQPWATLACIEEQYEWNFALAESHWQRALSIDPRGATPRAQRAVWACFRGELSTADLDGAIERAPVILAESGRHQWILGLLAWIYGRAGRAEAARAVRDELEGRSRHEFVSPFWLATAASAAGLTDEAMRLVERAVLECDPLILWSRITPFWQSIREHPGFGDAVRTVWS